MSGRVLALNAGSSSIRFAVFDGDGVFARRLHGKLEQNGDRRAHLVYRDAPDAVVLSVPVDCASPLEAARTFIEWLDAHGALEGEIAIGHRIVQGGSRDASCLATPDLVSELRELTLDDPEHLPLQIELIEGIRAFAPELIQVACFDASFHSSLLPVAVRLPIPERFHAMGIRRRGFHGLSFAWAMRELERVAGRSAAQGRVVLAHLGGGSSLAAVRGGRCIDTTMGFTPTGGVPMGTRSGDLDPGVLFAMRRRAGLGIEDLDRIVTHESGLIGVSGTSADVKELLAREGADEDARLALDLYCYRVRKEIGAQAAALGGLNTLIFTGGIGENAPAIRTRICAGLDFLGLEIDNDANFWSQPLLSRSGSRVAIRMIRANEEFMIASEVRSLLPSEAARPEWREDAQPFSRRRRLESSVALLDPA